MVEKKAERIGPFCSLCRKRPAAPRNKWGYCSTCASNIGGLLTKNLEDPDYLETYETFLMLRRERVRLARAKGKNTYAHQLLVKRRVVPNSA